jgi:hypothetical protein
MRRAVEVMLGIAIDQCDWEAVTLKNGVNACQ